MYLNIVFPAASSLLDKFTVQYVNDARARSFAKRDEAARRSLVDTLPACIPTLRYLTVSRSFSLDQGHEERRVWACYRVTDARGVVEIPEWEGERVREYCRRAGDHEAFDEFDGECFVVSPCEARPD